MNIHVTYLCYFIFIQSQYKGILFRLTYLFVKCFPCNNKILHVRCSAQNVSPCTLPHTQLCFIALCFDRFSIAIDFSYKVYKLVSFSCICFQFTRNIDRCKGLNSSPVLSTPASLCYAV